VYRRNETDAVRWWAANAKLSTMSVGALLPSHGLLSLEMMDAVHTAAMPQ